MSEKMYRYEEAYFHEGILELRLREFNIVRRTKHAYPVNTP